MNIKLTECVQKSPLSFRVYAWVLTLVTLVTIVLLMQGRYGKQEIVQGVIREGAYYRVSPNKPGNVVEVYVKEGDTVKKGDKLLRVSLLWQDSNNKNTNESIYDETATRLGKIKETLLEEKNNLHKELIEINVRKVNYAKNYREAIEKIDLIKSDYSKKREIYKSQLADYNRLIKSKAITKAELENTKQNDVDNELAIKKVDIEKNALEKEREEKELSFHRIEREIIQSRSVLEKRISDNENEMNNIALQQDYIVTAPADSIVHDIGIRQGDYIDGAMPSVILKGESNTQSFAILYLTTQQIGLLDKDEELFIRIDTFPYENYGTLSARVTNVSDTPIKLSLDQKESLFRVKVNLSEGRGRIPLFALKDGMTLTTSLRQPPLTLLEWLFLPVVKTFKRNPDILEK
ncbi:HlyD family efflux transporter periplasmic adaptor subunit [Pantoea sp. B9002]|uniref:HlyD family secretion protein n=1 Tax=Pantoea sp. B9002 TaxID=2726979 RepID=UPI0015A3DBCD|nr:biotin/lipoyl-binding protein [Pantoea sp. B9002]NWA62798.1 HlyD family efflux transporter periplasmic adaptor subunit [Pantoea sp. B9002]